MKIGFIGLGRMGAGMVQNLAERGHQVVVFNRSPDKTRRFAKKKNIIPSFSLQEFFSLLPKRKVVWLMIKAGKPVDDQIKALLPFLSKGDIIIDGGNSYFKDSQRRYKMLKRVGVSFLDCGVSGGIAGARNGACLMIGGDKPAFTAASPLFKSLSVKNGFGFMGVSGAGHFIKGVHNGIEYGMMGAINEGFKAIEKFQKTFKTDSKEVAKVYAHGSIIEGRLMSWLYQSFQTPGYLKQISCTVPKGETEGEMRKLSKMAHMPVLKQAVKMREDSRNGKVCGDYIAAMRNQFGGHKVNKKRSKK